MCENIVTYVQSPLSEEREIDGRKTLWFHNSCLSNYMPTLEDYDMRKGPMQEKIIIKSKYVAHDRWPTCIMLP